MVQTDKDLRDRGLQILAFPCNQFGGQEPGTPAEIDRFARGKYGAQFPVLAKIDVNGPDAHPIFQYLRSHSALYDPATGTAAVIPWNFAKFLVDGSGKVQKYYKPTDDLEVVRKDIEALLKSE